MLRVPATTAVFEVTRDVTRDVTLGMTRRLSPAGRCPESGAPRTLLTRLGIRKPSVTGLAGPPRAARTFSLDDLLKPPPRRKEWWPSSRAIPFHIDIRIAGELRTALSCISSCRHDHESRIRLWEPNYTLIDGNT